jgi:hypothetical protein
LTVTGPLTGRLAFDVVGSTLTLSLNGAQLLSKMNSSLTSGLVGIRGRNATFGSFDVQ